MAELSLNPEVRDMPPTIRPATTSDIPAISALVNCFAAQDVMLPRSEAKVRASLTDYVVAEDDDRLVGCGSLANLTPQLAEIRALAVAPDYHGRGLGARLVAALLEMAEARKIPQVCALTLRPDFFQRQGFQVVDRWHLAPKIWGECIHCPKYHRCDEVAVLLNLAEPHQLPEQAPWWSSFAHHAPLPVLRLLASRRT
jgi:amino-acid N-acetyltransferase